MSCPCIHQAVIAVARRRGGTRPDLHHVDIGAGRGELIRSIGIASPVESRACDFHVERFGVKELACKQVDLDHEPLPYPSATFDVVRGRRAPGELPRPVARGIRVTAPGGVAIFTTPIVFDAGSRARYLVSGFATLFGPLPSRNDRRSSTGGHITPIPSFDLAHALLQAGFDDVDLAIDRVQRVSVAWLALLAPFIFAGRLRFLRRAEGAGAQSGMTAVTSISTFARSSISAATCTAVIAGKWRPIVAR